MKGLLKSKLVLSLAAFIMIVAAIAIPLARSITRARAQSTVTFSEFPIPTANSNTLDITSGPDGNLWFVEFNGEKIGKITPNGTVTEYAIPTSNSNPAGITSGPDGNVWFTEQFGPSQIGKITPSGTITEYPTPSPSASPTGITSGPDGNVWFTEQFANKIAKSTPSGTITEYPIPTSNSGPGGITSGPNGNLWFTEGNANQIGKITTSGTVTEYAIPTSNSNPAHITSGPDGNLWFVESNANQIGKITPSGTITEYPIPTSGSDPIGITSGPDGNLWFTEFLGGNIGTITPGGTITEYPIPSGFGHPNGITSGPDHNIWFIEGIGNAIGRVNLSSTTPIPNKIYAGYAVSGSPFPNPSQPTKVLYSDVKGSWQVPTATCSKGENSDVAFWVGLGGVQDLEQIAIVIDCTKGKLTYFAAYEVITTVNGHVSGQVVCIGKGVIHIHTGNITCVGRNQASGVVKPSDSIDAEVSYQGSGNYLLKMHNLTQNWNFTRTVSGSADDQARNAADWITEAPPLCPPKANNCPNGQGLKVSLLTKFSASVHFQNCTADGNPISSGPTINKFLMTVGGTPTGAPKATPSADLDTNGIGFTVTWESEGIVEPYP